jgi:uncharacterized glyoxalase superfamily metalloenzyme YdcJ
VEKSTREELDADNCDISAEEELEAVAWRKSTVVDVAADTLKRPSCHIAAEVGVIGSTILNKSCRRFRSLART